MHQSGHRYHSDNLSSVLGALPMSLSLATETARGLGTKTAQAWFRWYRYRSDNPELATRFVPREPKVAQRRNSKSSSKNEGIPPEGCWQNQSGYRYHSANFSPVLGVLHAGHKPVTEPLGTGLQNHSGMGFDGMLHESRQLATARRHTDTTRKTLNLQPGVFHEGRKPSTSFSRVTS